MPSSSLHTIMSSTVALYNLLCHSSTVLVFCCCLDSSIKPLLCYQSPVFSYISANHSCSCLQVHLVNNLRHLLYISTATTKQFPVLFILSSLTYRPLKKLSFVDHTHVFFFLTSVMNHHCIVILLCDLSGNQTMLHYHTVCNKMIPVHTFRARTI